jgi:hypothetical protein
VLLQNFLLLEENPPRNGGGLKMRMRETAGASRT